MNSTIVKSVVEYSDDYYKLSIERNDILFKAGQYIEIKLENMGHYRMFSIYSGEEGNDIELFFKKIRDHSLNSRLKAFTHQRLVRKHKSGSVKTAYIWP